MKNKILVLMVIIGVFLSVGVYLLTRVISFEQELSIVIHNNTEMEITEFYLTYDDLSQDILLDNISAGNTLRLNVNPDENISESSLILYYYDNDNVTQEVTVIGYFEHHGGGQKSVVTIKSMDENGICEIEVRFITL